MGIIQNLNKEVEFPHSDRHSYLNRYFYEKLGIDTGASSLEYGSVSQLERIIRDSIKKSITPSIRDEISKCKQEYYLIKNGRIEIGNTSINSSINTRRMSDATSQLQILGNSTNSTSFDSSYRDVIKGDYKAQFIFNGYTSSNLSRDDTLFSINFNNTSNVLNRSIYDYRFIKISVVLGDIYYLYRYNYQNRSNYHNRFNIYPRIRREHGEYVRYNYSELKARENLIVYRDYADLNKRRTTKPFDIIVDIEQFNSDAPDYVPRGHNIPPAKYYFFLDIVPVNILPGWHIADFFIKDIVFLK